VSWLRLNRWWLLVLPLAVALMVGGSSYRVRTFWWESGLHREAAASTPGEFVRVVDDFEDALGATRRTYEVRASGMEELDEIPQDFGDPEPVPSGAKAVRVALDFRAEPDQDLNYCRVMLVDADGVRYGGDTSDLLDQTNLCVPEDHPGPSSPLLKGSRRGVVPQGAERPASWSVEPIVLVPRDARPTSVWVTFTPPDYVRLPLPR
jgi:hypothetical protein